VISPFIIEITKSVKTKRVIKYPVFVPKLGVFVPKYPVFVPKLGVFNVIHLFTFFITI